jgi:hypothetical protein
MEKESVLDPWLEEWGCLVGFQMITDGYVSHGEDVGVALENGKGTNNVHLDMGKIAFWNGNGKGRRETWRRIFFFLARKQ